MEFHWIPAEYYTAFYFNTMLLCVLIVFFHTLIYNLEDRYTHVYSRYVGVSLVIFISFYIGFRPIHEVFADMVNYSKMFIGHQNNLFDLSVYSKDLYFQLFIKFCSGFMSVNTFFFICSLLYIIPLYFVSKKWFGHYWFYSFLMLVISFSFWGYGTNGIRNGIASSLTLLAFSREKRLWQIVWILISIGFHKSMVLPASAFILTWFVSSSRYYLWFWVLTIPLSLIFSTFWQDIFVGLVEDERTEYFTMEVDENKFTSTGFRWDFLLYSATGVLSGYYFIFKKRFTDPIYIQLFNVYLFSNAFWILVIRANFSNRFAFLSWFMLAIIIIYPWLKVIFTKEQHRKLGILICAYFLFTYIMNILI